MIGQQLEQYRIDARQGRGNLGTVYRAFDTGLIRPVALKIINPHYTADRALQTHIMKQARAAAKLIHPSIATIYNFANNGTHLYIVSEFVTGVSMSSLLAQLAFQQKSIRISEVLYLTADLADALAYAHQQGVLHRNLKPSNILLKGTEADVHRHLGAPIRVILTDFGVTSHISGDVKSNPYDLGAGLHYMSPEQCIGSRIDGRSDIYALGLILYEILTGRRPFTIHTPVDAMLKHALETPPLLTDYAPDVPTEVASLVNQAIAKQPQKRLTDMRHFADALRHAAAAVQDAPHRQSIQTLLSDSFREDAMSTYTKPQRVLGEPFGMLPVHEDELASILQEALVDESESLLLDEDAQRAESAHTPPLPHLIQSDGAITQVNKPEENVIIQRPGYDPITQALDKDVLTIGRSNRCDITLDAPDVSRRHAMLKKSVTGWQVIDLNSTGGTYWGGHRLLPDIPEPWNKTQLLRIGPFSLRWQPEIEIETLSTPAHGEDEPVTQLHLVPLDGVQSGSTKGQFSLMVNPILLTVNPGAQGIMQVELFNRSTSADSFKVQLLDLPPIVTTMSQNLVYLAPGERATLPLTIATESNRAIGAGHYPFQIMVQRESDPTDTAVVAARLTIGQAEAFTIGVWPLEIPQDGACQVLIRNEGNTSARFALTGHSANPSVRFLGERGQVRLEPGQATTLALTVAAQKRPLFGRRQHVPFTVKVRSESGREEVENGRLAVNPHLPAWILPAAEIALVLLFVIFAASTYFANGRTEEPIISALEQEAPTDAPFGDAPDIATLDEDASDDTVGVVGEEGDNSALLADSDEDGLSDDDETEIYGTDPTSFDSDGDGLTDGDEVLRFETDPLFADTDLDGVSDGEEVSLGTDPRRFNNASGGANSSLGEGDLVEDESFGEEDAFFNQSEDDSFSGSGADEFFDDAFNGDEVPEEEDAFFDDDEGNFVPDESSDSGGADDGNPRPEPTDLPIEDEPTAVPTIPPSEEQTTTELTVLDSGTGWVSQSGNVSSNPAAPIIVGDTDSGDTVRGYYSYDISAIPEGAQLHSATIAFGSSITINGSPFDDLDCLLIEASEFSLPLDEQDFEADSFYIDCIETLPTTFDVLIDLEAALDFDLETLQFRLSFSDVTDFDTEADQILLSTLPTLSVTYTP